VSVDNRRADLYTYTDDGSASIGGDVQDSAISASEDQAWYLYIEDSYGGVSITTSFSNSALHADDDDAIYIYVDNDQNQNLQAGSFSVAPTISGGTLYAGYGDGLYIDAYGNADTSDLSVAPSLDGVSINAYYDGIYINVDDDAYYDANEDSVFWPGKVHLGGHVNDSVINALDEYGVELDAYCDSGGYCRDGALNDFSAHNTAIYSYDDAWYSYTDSYAGQAASAPQLTSDNSSLWKSAYGSGVDVETDGYGESGQQDDMAVKGLLITAYDYGVSIEDSASYGASAVNNAVVDGNTITTTNDDGVYDDTGVESGGTATRNGAISNNVIHGTSSSGDGIEHYLGAPQPESEIDNLAITGNTIVGVGGDGIYVYTQGNEPTDGSSKITISGNTVRSTGNSGIAAYSVIADITGNQQSLSNLGGSETMPTVIGESQNAGIVVADAPIPGQLSCNMIVGNDTGVLYSGNAAGDPVTHQNSFQDDNGVTNRPVNLATDNASDAPTDATQNYWGMTTEDAIQSTVEGNVTVTPFLTSPAPCSLQASNPPPVQGGGGGGGTPPPTSLTVKSSDQPLGPNNPFIVTVTDPNGGPITFGAGNPPALPPGVDELKNFSFDIAAPASTASNPLTLVFEFDPSASPNGMPIVILRDGVPVTQSCASPTVASPDPCLKSYSVSDTGAVTITILSSHASNWTATLPQSGSIALACSSAGANPFTDVPASDVHKDAIACLNSFGITKGTTATTYSPSATVTRGQMAAFIARLLTDAGVSLGTGATGPFTDVSAASTFAQAINQLAAKGVVKGVTPTQYSPGTPVSRGQMAAFLVRAYELASGHTLPVATAPFTDISGNTFTTEIGKVWEVGITQGLTATSYAPEAPVQRDQMASFIARTLNLLFAQGLVA
jgi:hypothetical protein